MQALLEIVHLLCITYKLIVTIALLDTELLDTLLHLRKLFVELVNDLCNVFDPVRLFFEERQIAFPILRVGQ